MSSSSALARIETKTKEAEAEKIPPMTAISVPAALLLAAESVIAKPGGPKTYLEGVYVHRKGDKGRVVGTDGARMFIASFPLPTKEEGGPPPWMQEGVILSGLHLKSRVALLGKITGENDVLISYAKGNASVDLADARSETVFKLAALHGTYPDYEGALGAKSFADLDADGNQESREWQPVGINSSYLKQCGDIAKVLERGLEASARSKLGMVVRAFNGGSADSPLVFDFSTWPGAILIVAPAVMVSAVTSKETAQLLAPAIKATIAALRAHATRWDQRAAEAVDERFKVEAKAKAETFRSRIADILRTVPVTGPAIGATKPVKTPEPAPQAAAPAPDASAEQEQRPETKRPATKRTKIKVPDAQQTAA